MSEPKIQAILDIISSAGDRYGNSSYAFRYTRTSDGKQVRGKISGNDSNISAIVGECGLVDWNRTYCTKHELGIRPFENLTAGWPYAGCAPKTIAEFIRVGMESKHYEDPVLSIDRASKSYCLFDGFQALGEFQPYTREEDAIQKAKEYFGTYNQFEIKYPRVTKMRAL